MRSVGAGRWDILGLAGKLGLQLTFILMAIGSGVGIWAYAPGRGAALWREAG